MSSSCTRRNHCCTAVVCSSAPNHTADSSTAAHQRWGSASGLQGSKSASRSMNAARQRSVLAASASRSGAWGLGVARTGMSSGAAAISSGTPSRSAQRSAITRSRWIHDSQRCARWCARLKGCSART
ncbi:hypothetical protein [Caldimonas thermodepolymerans]|jgi:hypothetical protein|uniref:hypothetical protein n=1 Tax=Caldimonas thermodepolymerans TaxID=215580 RepID=UPI00223640F8|nr:hypothetical protein [Caldimonas thermodepolymerans]UZG46032.1 hypothetical protein ONZ46_08855 [Caldimonas thermodepolymerans]